MNLYTAGIVDVDYLQPYLPLLFVMTFLLSGSRLVSSMAVGFAQHFKETQNRSIMESLLNVTMSLLLVPYWGIYGVLAGTVFALIYRTNDLIIYANRAVLHRSPWPSYRRLIVCFCTFGFLFFLQEQVHFELNSYWQIIAWAAVISLIVLPLYFVLVSLFEKQARGDVKEILSLYLEKAMKKNRQS